MQSIKADGGGSLGQNRSGTNPTYTGKNGCIIRNPSNISILIKHYVRVKEYIIIIIHGGIPTCNRNSCRVGFPHGFFNLYSASSNSNIK